jgi:hypothetical protein
MTLAGSAASGGMYIRQYFSTITGNAFGLTNGFYTNIVANGDIWIGGGSIIAGSYEAITLMGNGTNGNLVLKSNTGKVTLIGITNSTAFVPENATIDMTYVDIIAPNTSNGDITIAGTDLGGASSTTLLIDRVVLIRSGGTGKTQVFNAGRDLTISGYAVGGARSAIESFRGGVGHTALWKAGNDVILSGDVGGPGTAANWFSSVWGNVVILNYANVDSGRNFTIQGSTVGTSYLAKITESSGVANVALPLAGSSAGTTNGPVYNGAEINTPVGFYASGNMYGLSSAVAGATYQTANYYGLSTTTNCTSSCVSKNYGTGSVTAAGDISINGSGRFYNGVIVRDVPLVSSGGSVTITC